MMRIMEPAGSLPGGRGVRRRVAGPAVFVERRRFDVAGWWEWDRSRGVWALSVVMSPCREIGSLLDECGPV